MDTKYIYLSWKFIMDTKYNSIGDNSILIILKISSY
jgi:hypothetical protein